MPLFFLLIFYLKNVVKITTIIQGNSPFKPGSIDLCNVRSLHHSRCHIHVHSVHACRFIMIHTSTRNAVIHLYLQFGFSCAVPVPRDSFLSPRANNGGQRPSILPLVSIINYVVQSTYAQHDRLATCCCRVFSSKRILKGSVSISIKIQNSKFFC